MEDLDYLRILEGGNFISFTCMASDEDDKKAVIDTDTLRLKVPLTAAHFYYEPFPCPPSFLRPLI